MAREIETEKEARAVAGPETEYEKFLDEGGMTRTERPRIVQERGTGAWVPKDEVRR